MSTIHELPHAVDAEDDNVDHGVDHGVDAGPPGARWSSRGRILAVAVALLAVGGAVVVSGRGSGTALPGTGGFGFSAAEPGAPVTLPSSLTGLGAVPAGDLTRTAEWQLKARQAGAGATVDGRTYGAGGGARSIRLVVGRTDLTGKLDLLWAADAGRLVGAVRCTDNTRVTPTSKPRIRPTVMLCWRTTAALSVSALILDPRATTPVTAEDGAAAVDVGWRIAQNNG